MTSLRYSKMFPQLTAVSLFSLSADRVVNGYCLTGGFEEGPEVADTHHNCENAETSGSVRLVPDVAQVWSSSHLIL